MADEERETGAVSLQIYIRYFKAATLLLSVSTITLFSVRQVFKVIIDFWLAAWAEASRQFENAWFGIINVTEPYLESAVFTVSNSSSDIVVSATFLSLHCMLGLVQTKTLWAFTVTIHTPNAL